MKITVINGSMRHGSTWHCMEAVRQELGKYDTVQMTEFFLPGDMPYFCSGCYSCFYNGESTCPHASATEPIARAILEADLVVLLSPVYGFDVSGQMKALIDHLCYMWMSHRPDPRMFNKIGLTITTTAGAGLAHTTKTLRNSLTFWGVKKTFSLKYRAAATKWDEVPAKKQIKIRRDAARSAARIARAVKNVKKLPNPLFRSFMFKMMAGAQKKNDWNPVDRKHWESQGWLSGARPF
ncbi:NADPH-dependent FMN reductase [Sporobacter termitidis DSM 10068]|uniref:NADPH-dependent FMN reductase n=1 Tax=Sporobacter termitidis DSM 10068 TaxID=1123282 RepID=A0A1M5YXT8_9FIRM|nr:NAD(P)H-dependent oxidoreductase [Sporobacter termitidis]SHI16879.1 NADPH-dependent FMN reductase [Sporobacter termitidis DSM 10068]